jgi:hypothetical protein
MAVVMVVGLDCGLARFFVSTGDGLGGLFALGLAISAGLIVALLTCGRPRRFAVGFLVTTSLAAVALVAAAVALPEFVGEVFIAYLNRVLRWLPPSVFTVESMTASVPGLVESTRLSLLGMLFIEVAVSLPLLTLALVGGLLALAVQRRELSNPATSPT